MGISRIFDMSRRSLAVYQKAMDITSHNIANSSNENYTRQISVFNTVEPEVSGGFIWGTGVQLEQVLRVRDNLIDKQINNYHQKYSDADKQLEYLSQIEQIFSEPSDLGLANLMTQFFNKWNELAVSPNSSALRNSVLNASQNLTEKISNIYEQFGLVKTDIVNQFDSKVDEINGLINNIKDLNDTIYTASINGANPNDLLDQRDAKIEELNKLINTTVTFNKNGGAIVNIGGITVVNESYVVELKSSNENGQLSLLSNIGDHSVALTGGEIFALKKVYSERLPQYESDLDTIIEQLYTSVNSIHSTGYSTTTPPKTGIEFFTSYSEGSLVINPDILSDPRLIAVSSDGTNGDGSLANAISSLSTQKLLDGESLADKYNTLINRIGSDVLTNQRQADSTDMILEQLKNQRASNSGVSLDEEMANILKFQRSYDAAAKLIQIANEMLDSLMNII